MPKFNYEIVSFDPDNYVVNARYTDSYGDQITIQSAIPYLDSNWEQTVKDTIEEAYPYAWFQEYVAPTPNFSISDSDVDDFVGTTVTDAVYQHTDREEYGIEENDFAILLRRVMDQVTDLGAVWCDSDTMNVYAIPFTNQILTQQLKKTIGQRSDTDKVLVTDLSTDVVYVDFVQNKPGPSLISMSNNRLDEITGRLIAFQEQFEEVTSAAARVHQNARETYDAEAVEEAAHFFRIRGNAIAAVAQAVYYNARNANVCTTVQENYAHLEDYITTAVPNAPGCWDWSKMRFNASARHSGNDDVVTPSTVAYPGAGINSVYGDIQGQLVGGAAFDSAQDCVTMSGDGQFMSATVNSVAPSNGFSVGVWYNPSNSANISVAHLSDSDESAHHGVLEVNGGNFYAGVGSASVTASGASTGSVTHALVTYDGDKVSLYVDGVKKGSATGVTNTIDNNDVVLKIGGLTDNSYTGLTGNTVGEMDGKLYRVTMHEAGLDSDQAIALYTAEHGLVGQYL